MICTIWNAAIGSSSWRVRLGGRGITFPSQSGALQLPITAQRLSLRKMTLPWRSWTKSIRVGLTDRPWFARIA
jgi:hypothetical protein